jgi:hypothetical protein
MIITLQFHLDVIVFVTERMNMTHNELVERAEKWLKNNGCGVVFKELRAFSATGEVPDVIGWRHEASILIECKTSRADFLSDKNKKFRKNPVKGMGDWRFYLCPPNVITVDDLPGGWGLLYANPKTIKKVHGFPKKDIWHHNKPFHGNKLCEMSMMYSALRRMEIRGHLNEIYDGIPEGVY